MCAVTSNCSVINHTSEAAHVCLPLLVRCWGSKTSGFQAELVLLLLQWNRWGFLGDSVCVFVCVCVCVCLCPTKEGKQEMERENKATITEQHRAGVSGSARLYDVM